MAASEGLCRSCLVLEDLSGFYVILRRWRGVSKKKELLFCKRGVAILPSLLFLSPVRDSLNLLALQMGTGVRRGTIVSLSIACAYCF